MPDWLQHILVSFLTAVLGTGGFLWLIRAKYEAKIKKDLDSHAQLLKHDLEKDMLHAQAVAQSKHIIYPKLFELLRHYDGTFNPLDDVQWLSTFEEWSRDEFEQKLKKEGIKTKMRERILVAWDRGCEEGVKEYYAYKRVMDLNSSDMARIEVNNYLLLKSLYISQPVYNAVDHLIDEIRDLINFYRKEDEPRDRTWSAQVGSSKDRIPKLFKGLEALMKRELGSVDNNSK